MSSRRRNASMCVMLLALVSWRHERSFLASTPTPLVVVEKIESTPSSQVPKASNATTIRSKEEDVTDTSSKREEFSAENIGYQSKVPCGAQKCFYRLKTKRQVGYLVSPERKSDRLKVLNDGWELSERLKSKYGIRHFLLGPPTPTKVSGELAKRLNRNLYIERSRKIQKGRHAKRFPKGSTVFVQKVKLAPKKHLMIGCAKSKRRSFKKDVKKFLPQVKDGHLETFVQNLSKNLADTKAILDDEPCLFKDFQVLIDTKGNLYHLDFDRCYRSSGETFNMKEKYTQSCLRALGRFEQDIQRSLMSRQEEKAS